MAFVNEYIPEADYDKYDLRRICGEHNYAHRGDMHSRSWTIDREREAFIIKTWSHHEAEFDGWAFYWHGQWLFFEQRPIASLFIKVDECWSRYQIKGFVISPALEAQREALLADFQAAWLAHAGGGVFCKAAHGSATLEFIEGQVHK